MALIDRRKSYRGRKAKLGSVIITRDSQLAFFVGYCDCGCNAKIGLSSDEAKTFAMRFYRESEPPLIRVIASPTRAARYLRNIFREAHKVAIAQKDSERAW